MYWRGRRPLPDAGRSGRHAAPGILGRSGAVLGIVLLASTAFTLSGPLAGRLAAASPAQISNFPDPMGAGVRSASTSYTVVFEETGLAASVSWGVSLYLIGSTWNTQWDAYSNSTSISLTDGSYYYELDLYTSANYSANNSAGYLDVNGSGLTISVHFIFLVPVHFLAEGVPNGTSWDVQAGGATHSTSAGSLWFNIPNDTRTLYSVDPPPGYTSTPASGSLLANGTTLTVHLNFTIDTTSPRYAVWFNESGLAANVSWSVTVELTTKNSSTDSIELLLVNGSSYPYSVTGTDGFTPSVPSGYVSVSGYAVDVLTSFSYVVGTYTLPVWFNGSGLPSNANEPGGSPWTVTVRGGASETSAAPSQVSPTSVEFGLPSGSNGSFWVDPPVGYYATPSAGAYRVPEVGGGTTISLAFHVRPAPLVVDTFVAVPAAVRPGQWFNLTTSVSGGLPNPTYAFYGLPGDCNSMNTSTLPCRSNGLGSFLVEVVVHDALGDRATGNVTVTISNASASGGAPSSSPGISAWIFVLPAVIAAALVGGVWAFRRRRRSGGSGVLGSP